MDTPLKEQIRQAQPEKEQASEEDQLELMEMILGALGRDALGMGSSIAHPKDSDEWKGMTVRYLFCSWCSHSCTLKWTDFVFAPFADG